MLDKEILQQVHQAMLDKEILQQIHQALLYKETSRYCSRYTSLAR